MTGKVGNIGGEGEKMKRMCFGKILASRSLKQLTQGGTGGRPKGKMSKTTPVESASVVKIYREIQ